MPQVTCNGQDYTDSGVAFVYQADNSVQNLSLASGLNPAGFGLFITGRNFVNSTGLTCRVGASEQRATFLSSSLALCFVPVAAFSSTPVLLEEARSRVEDTEDRRRGLGPQEEDSSSAKPWLQPEDEEGKVLLVEVRLDPARDEEGQGMSPPRSWR